MNAVSPVAPVEDLDAINASATNKIARRLELKEYDPRPGEDSARRRIAYALLIILAFVVFASFVSFWGGQPREVDSLIKFAQILLGPIVPLVSAATGFYYGTKSQKN
jgi:Mn2+/Fe2+ NRAMP family transporter